MTQCYGLFLDDERNPEDVTWMIYPQDTFWLIARTPEQFKALIGAMKFDIISFDNDIQAGDVEGYHLMHWLCEWIRLKREFYYQLPRIYVHSKNCVRNESIIAYWNNWVQHCWHNI